MSTTSLPAHSIFKTSSLSRFYPAFLARTNATFCTTVVPVGISFRLVAIAACGVGSLVRLMLTFNIKSLFTAMQVDVWVACAPPFSKLEKIKHREVLGRCKKSLVRKWKGSL